MLFETWTGHPNNAQPTTWHVFLLPPPQRMSSRIKLTDHILYYERMSLGLHKACVCGGGDVQSELGSDPSCLDHSFVQRNRHLSVTVRIRTHRILDLSYPRVRCVLSSTHVFHLGRGLGILLNHVPNHAVELCKLLKTFEVDD